MFGTLINLLTLGTCGIDYVTSPRLLCGSLACGGLVPAIVIPARAAREVFLRRLLDPFLRLREYAAAAALAALDGVSVTLPAGAVVAVVGEYGSGKTTLAKLLCKFYQPSAGTITVDGTGPASLDTAAWRAGISASFQAFGRYNATFREAVQLGGVEDGALPSNGDDAVLAAVAEAGAGDLLARLIVSHRFSTVAGADLILVMDSSQLAEGPGRMTDWPRRADDDASLRRSHHDDSKSPGPCAPGWSGQGTA